MTIQGSVIVIDGPLVNLFGLHATANLDLFRILFICRLSSQEVAGNRGIYDKIPILGNGNIRAQV